MNKLTIGLIIAGAINCVLIGWAITSKIEVEEWRTQNKNLVFILEKLNKIEGTTKNMKLQFEWYRDGFERIVRNTKGK